jgi:hypothetical protein
MTTRPKLDLGFQGALHELTVTDVLDRRGERRREDLGCVSALDLLEQVSNKAELTKLVFKESFPDRAHARISLGLDAAMVIVNFGRLVQEPFLEPRL